MKKLQIDDKLEYKDKFMKGIKLYPRFEKNLKKLSFKCIFIFKDGSWLKSKGKMFQNKVRKHGRPILVIDIDLFDYLTKEEKFSNKELARRESMAEDMKEDVIWMQKMLNSISIKNINK